VCLLTYTFLADVRILVVKKKPRGRHGGQLALPGGLVEPGETYLQAAARELLEEVGVPVSNIWGATPPSPHGTTAVRAGGAACALTAELTGALGDFKTYGTDIDVTCFTGVIDCPHDATEIVWQLDQDEVATVVDVSLTELCDPELFQVARDYLPPEIAQAARHIYRGYRGPLWSLPDRYGIWKMYSTKEVPSSEQHPLILWGLTARLIQVYFDAVEKCL